MQVQAFLEFVQYWFNAFSDLFRKLWHFLDDNDLLPEDEEEEEA